MEELKAQALELLSALDEDQIRSVLNYARALRDDEVPVVSLEELLEQPA
ncbi:MAG: hypothetical protein AB7O37_08375 [Vicinamibacteria bacterium]